MAVIVITGATGAVGRATAEAVAKPGNAVLLLSRPSERLTAAASAVRGKGAEAVEVPVDLASLSSIRDACREVAATAPRIDALVLTAAVFTTRLRMTADGFESMFATDHLAPFLLTNLLRRSLGEGSRVITVAAPSNTPVDADQLATGSGFKPLTTFGAAKAANLLFTFELARRGAKAGVRANAFHPGLVRSGLMSESPLPLRVVLGLVSRTPAAAAKSLATLATAPEFEDATGKFFKGTKAATPPSRSTETTAQRLLWERSAELVGLEAGGF